MNPNTQLGSEGEDQAVAFLKAKGFKIIVRNFRYKHGEIDIIAHDHEILVFIEVKFRKNNFYGYPEQFVSNGQRSKIRATAEQYLYKENWLKRIRFDIIAITGDEEPVHFIDAF